MNGRQAISSLISNIIKLIFNVETIGHNQGLVPEIGGNNLSISLISAHFLVKNA